MRAKGMGAKVIICEVEPLRALRAAMDGYQVMPIGAAAQIGEIFVTVTGDRSVIRREHFAVMKDGAVLANSGHFDVEIDLTDLRDMTTTVRTIRPNLEAYHLHDGRELFVIGQGRLANLAAAEGHPASVMDMSFSNQALCAEYVAGLEQPLPVAVHSVPQHIDQQIAALKLETMGISIDTLTPAQEEYLSSWKMGT